MNFIMLLLGLTAMTIFFYEVLSAREYSQYSPLDPYKFPTYIIQLTPFVLIQLYWSRKIRNSEFISAILSVIMIPAIFLSLYFDVFSLFHRDFLFVPGSWTMFLPSYIDMVIFLGTVFFPLTSFILLILLYKQIRSIIEIHYKNKKNISESRRSFMISIFEKFKK
jgi:molybdopterin-containing oxidoreductase family membrane subunit